MTAAGQIMLGSAVLCLCAVWHIYVLSDLIMRVHRRFGERLKVAKGNFRLTVVIFLAILFAHTVQVYIWASAFWFVGALSGPQDALYFSLVTYTTLGYGDIVLGPGFRMFAAMEAVNGVLMFGLSTAFLVSYFSDVLRRK